MAERIARSAAELAMVQSQVLYRSDAMSIEYYFRPDHKNRQLAFVFSSLGKILNRNINGGDYLIENGFDVDVLPMGLSPHLHYIRYGRPEQRTIRFRKSG
ncbi:MAG: hypothetical protein QOC72_1515 [Methylobacteriaceae bacterium]|jgi:hypothetical protein|nr:hypothetical protein [Methylobacteriaceae bacterium]